MTPFGRLLFQTIKDQKLKQTSFGKMVGTPLATLNSVISGRMRPPAEVQEEWANALGLTGKAKQEFLDLAALEHLPDEFKPRFIALTGLAASPLGGSSRSHLPSAPVDQSDAERDREDYRRALEQDKIQDEQPAKRRKRRHA